MRPHDSQASRENETPSSGTSPVASYKEVPPPPHPELSLGQRRRDVVDSLLYYQLLGTNYRMCRQTGRTIISYHEKSEQAKMNDS